MLILAGFSEIIGVSFSSSKELVPFSITSVDATFKVVVALTFSLFSVLISSSSSSLDISVAEEFLESVDDEEDLEVEDDLEIEVEAEEDNMVEVGFSSPIIAVGPSRVSVSVDSIIERLSVSSRSSAEVALDDPLVVVIVEEEVLTLFELVIVDCILLVADGLSSSIVVVRFSWSTEAVGFSSSVVAVGFSSSVVAVGFPSSVLAVDFSSSIVAVDSSSLLVAVCFSFWSTAVDFSSLSVTVGFSSSSVAIVFSSLSRGTVKLCFLSDKILVVLTAFTVALTGLLSGLTSGLALASFASSGVSTEAPSIAIPFGIYNYN